MFRNPWQGTTLVLALAAMAAACQPDTARLTGAPDPGPHTAGFSKGLTLLLTDAPGDILAAVVTIKEVYLQGQGGRTVLRDTPITTDLLTLRDAVATLVQEAEIPPGRYSELRMVLSGAYIEVETETSSRIYATSEDYHGVPAGASVDGRLHTPSMDASGIKVKLPGNHLDIGAGHMVLLIDFDVAETFGHQAGQSGMWVMNPVVRATDVTFAGHLTAQLQLGTGITLPALNGNQVSLGDFTARVTPAGGGTARELVLTDADGDGVFDATFIGLAPGQYSLEIVAPPGVIVALSPASPANVDILASHTATQMFTVTSAAFAPSVVANLSLAAGVTLPSVEGAAVTLGQFSARLAPTGSGSPVDVGFTDPDGDGTFSAAFPNLAPGQYSLTVLVPAGITVTLAPVPPVNLDLAPGDTVVQAFVVAAAS